MAVKITGPTASWGHKIAIAVIIDQQAVSIQSPFPKPDSLLYLLRKSSGRDGNIMCFEA